MKHLLIYLAVALLCGCAVDRSLSETSNTVGPINKIAAQSIAERVVREREHWRKVVSEARSVERGWKVFVARRPYSPHDPMVNVTLDARGQVLEYDKFRNYE
jgi:hypothetical protein